MLVYNFETSTSKHFSKKGYDFPKMDMFLVSSAAGLAKGSLAALSQLGPIEDVMVRAFDVRCVNLELSEAGTTEDSLSFLLVLR
jgi:hypothetical protein